MTVPTLLTAVLLCSFAYYLYFLLRAAKGLSRLSEPTDLAQFQRVSVVIAARNEEQSIGSCLQSISEQDYPHDHLEVIVVDDDSTDRTADIVNQFSRQNARVILITLPPHPFDSGVRKQAAIARGIEESNGSVIATTDADCVVTKDWIRSMTAYLTQDTAFVAGPVVEVDSPSLVAKLSRIEFLGLVGIAAGLIGAKRPIFCNGANLVYRRSAFFDAGGFGSSKGFSDDEVLMQRVYTRNPESISFSSTQGSIVSTFGPTSIREFLRQRTRWSSKKGHYENKSILVKLVFLYLFFLLMLVAGVGTMFERDFAIVVGSLFMTKMVADVLFLLKTSNIFRQPLSLPYFFIAELFHVPYIVITAFIGQFSSLHWKGKILRS